VLSLCKDKRVQPAEAFPRICIVGYDCVRSLTLESHELS
jgi:hypothetical protein